MTGNSIRRAFVSCICKYIKRTVCETVYDIPKTNKIAISDPEKILKIFRSQHLQSCETEEQFKIDHTYILSGVSYSNLLET